MSAPLPRVQISPQLRKEEQTESIPFHNETGSWPRPDLCVAEDTLSAWREGHAPLERDGIA